MPDMILLGLALYALGAVAGVVLVATSPLPAALFWGVGMVLQAAEAAAEILGYFSIPLLSGMEGDIRYYNLTLGPIGLTLGTVFSLVIPAGSPRLTLYSGIGLAVVIAAALDRLPVGQIPLPLILLGILVITVLAGLRRRPAPGRWLLLATVAAVLSELARYGHLTAIPLPSGAVAHSFLAVALVSFGMTANRTQ